MRVFLIFVGLLVASPVQAEVLKLKDIVDVAVRQSPEFATAKVDLDLARAQLAGAEGVHDTHVGVTASGSVSKAAVAGQFQAGRDRSVGGSAYIAKLLSTGGTFAVTAGSSYSHTTSFVPDGMGAQVQRDAKVYGQSLEVSLVQPLLKGAGGAATDGTIRAAEFARDAAALDREARARELVVAITLAYWQVALAKAQLEVQRGAVSQAEKQLDLTQGAIRADKVAKSELIAVEGAIAARQATVIVAEQDLLERSLALRQLAGLDIAPDAIAVETEQLPKIDKLDVDIAPAVKAAFDKSARLSRLGADVKAARASLERADALARSTLDLDLRAGPFATGATFNGSVKNITDGVGYQASASLRFDHAIGMGVETGAVLAARAVVNDAVIAERAARAEIAALAVRAVQRAKAALATIALGDKAIALAEQSIDAEQKRFELGKTTNFEILRRQDELQSARLRKITAVVDYLNARAELDGLSGTILTKYGVVLR